MMKVCRAGFAVGLGSCGAGLALLGIVWLCSQDAYATPGYATKTGLACGRCHVNPAGGGPNTSFGKAFAANGHKVPQKSAQKGASTNAPAAPVEEQGCGFYHSPACNPPYVRGPEINYSSGTSFMLFPQSD